MSDSVAQYPKPFLSRERTNELMEMLGFQFEDTGYPIDTPAGRVRMSALEELIAGAIAEWSDARPEGDGETWDGYNNELLTWAEEYLVG